MPNVTFFGIIQFWEPKKSANLKFLNILNLVNGSNCQNFVRKHDQRKIISVIFTLFLIFMQTLNLLCMYMKR